MLCNGLIVSLQFAGPEVRWVDNQRNVFRVSMRLVSTVLSSDQHLHNFFQSSSSLLPLTGSSSGVCGASSPRSAQPIDIDTLKNLKVCFVCSFIFKILCMYSTELI